jgi:hypothetical protein
MVAALLQAELALLIAFGEAQWGRPRRKVQYLLTGRPLSSWSTVVRRACLRCAPPKQEDGPGRAIARRTPRCSPIQGEAREAFRPRVGLKPGHLATSVLFFGQDHRVDQGLVATLGPSLWGIAIGEGIGGFGGWQQEAVSDEHTTS